MPSLPGFSIQQLDALTPLPDDFSTVKDGRYVIKTTDSIDQEADGPDVKTKIWFQTKPLEENEIKRIRGLKLYTESHDQGYTSDPNAGNWTWFEYAIVEGLSDHAKVQDGIRLVWTSHMNIREDTKSINGLPAGFYRADNFQPTDAAPLRVLSFDGGGVRGLSSLMLLKAVMDRISPSKKPCQVFDMIGGTSTGGRLIAIMLGRLEMTVDECITKYQDFMTKVFTISWLKRKAAEWHVGGDKYDAEILESCIKDVVKEKLGDENAMLLDNREGACKVFVTATRKDALDNRGPELLRSYQNPLEPSEQAGIEVWRAARATSAAPTYFESVTAGDKELVDGGLGANNPLGWLWNEVLSVFGPTRPTNCFLSIGTGIPKNVGIKGLMSLPEALASAATNSELTHILFRTLLDAYAPTSVTHKYWRLNVSVEIPAWDEQKSEYLGLKKYTVKHLDDYEDPGALDDLLAVKKLEEMTKGYIKAQDGVISECVKALQM
ncbi:hypothetical protein KCU65_g2571, partial [Aureobasidium melanogenum]